MIVDQLVAMNVVPDPLRCYFNSGYGPLLLGDLVTTENKSSITVHIKGCGGFEPAQQPCVAPDPLNSTEPNLNDELGTSDIPEPGEFDFSTDSDISNLLLKSDTEFSDLVASIAVATYNGRGGRNGFLREDLLKIINTNHPFIIHVVEYRTDEEVHLDNYKRFNRSYEQEKESDRQCVFIHTSIEDVTHMTPSYLYCHTFKILGQYLTFSYIPPSLSRDRTVPFIELRFGIRNRSILIGDFNSQCPSLQNGHNRIRRAFESFILDSCYEIQNTPFITTKSNSDNVLDLINCHQSTSIAINHVKVLQDIGTTSDHYAVTFEVTLPSPFLIARRIRFDLLHKDLIKTEKYYKKLCKLINNHDYTHFTSANKWKLFQNAIFLAGESCLGTVNVFQTPQSNLTDAMFNLEKGRNKLRKQLSNTRLSITQVCRKRSQLNQINNKIKQENVKIKRQHYEAYLEKINKSPNHVHYELCRLNKKSKRSNVHTKCDLTATTEYYKTHFHDHPSEWTTISTCITKEQYDVAYTIFTFEKVQHAANTANANKMSGDNIPAKALKNLPDIAIKLLQSVFIQSYLECAVPNQWQYSSVVEIFKSGDINLPARFRPICLISAAYKIYQQMLYYFFLRSMLIASNRQHGFQTKRSCMTQLMQVLNKLKDLVGGHIYGLAMDLSQAFDCLKHLTIADYIVDKLTSHDMNVLRYIITQQRYYFYRDSTKELFNFGRGTPQGGTLSPLLFAFILDCIISEFG